jgi:hypothetical protein
MRSSDIELQEQVFCVWLIAQIMIALITTPALWRSQVEEILFVGW